MDKDQIKRDAGDLRRWLYAREGDFEMGPGWDVLRHINTLLKEVEELEENSRFKVKIIANRGSHQLWLNNELIWDTADQQNYDGTLCEFRIIRKEEEELKAKLSRYREALEEIRVEMNERAFKEVKCYDAEDSRTYAQGFMQGVSIYNELIAAKALEEK